MFGKAAVAIIIMLLLVVVIIIMADTLFDMYLDRLSRCRVVFCYSSWS